MKFIDLFSGLGGFHIGLQRNGHQCVFACEIDPTLADIYEKNFGIMPKLDIRDVSVDEIPNHDILCAGFPCQPFSKAGNQLGLACPKDGDLFEKHIVRIIRYHKPTYLIFENVPNLIKHDSGKTWKYMKKLLEEEGYDIRTITISPHNIGIPQIRKRLFVIGSNKGFSDNPFPIFDTVIEPSIYSILEKKPSNPKGLSQQVLDCLEVWQEFLDRYPKEKPLPSFPIWSMEFGATYPYVNETPYSLGGKGLQNYLGSFGTELKNLDYEEINEIMPSYSMRKEKVFPLWKQRFIRQNRDLYIENQKWLDKWIPKISVFPHSLQKFEWNCKGEERNLWKLVIQFRASGVRVKRPTTAPSLVAMTTTQVPIISWEKRYMTVRECARLQSLDELEVLPDANTSAFKALGNAVNATVVEQIAKSMLNGHPGK